MFPVLLAGYMGRRPEKGSIIQHQDGTPVLDPLLTLTLYPGLVLLDTVQASLGYGGEARLALLSLRLLLFACYTTPPRGGVFCPHIRHTGGWLWREKRGEARAQVRNSSLGVFFFTSSLVFLLLLPPLSIVSDLLLLCCILGRLVQTCRVFHYYREDCRSFSFLD